MTTTFPSMRRLGVLITVLELPQSAVQLCAGDPEVSGRSRLITCNFAQRLCNGLSLENSQIGAGQRWRILRDCQREVLSVDERPLAHDGGSLDYVAQLAHIPWPAVG